MYIPYDIVLAHILPKCSIDTRLAFGIRPSKIDLTPFETGSLGESFRDRYNPKITRVQFVKDIHHVNVPLWPCVKSSDPPYCHPHLQPLCKCPVRLNIMYAYNRAQSRRVTDSIRIRVTKTDVRINGIFPERYVHVDTLTITSCGHVVR